MMLYLSGCVRPEILARPGLGVMLSPDIGNRPNLSVTPWAADNGCFATGERFDAGRWIAWLDSMAQWQSTCLFAVLPDVVADWRATWERSLPWIAVLRDRGWKPAIVLQDGCSWVPFELFDAVFVGGSTEYKLGPEVRRLVWEAKWCGKWVHMGRVNSWARVDYAHRIGCDSVDGTYIRYSPDRLLPVVDGWMDAVTAQEVLAL